MRRPHCEDISSSTYVGTAFSLFRVCPKNKPCFTPTNGTPEGVSHGIHNWTETERKRNRTTVNSKRKETERNWKLFFTRTVWTGVMCPIPFRVYTMPSSNHKYWKRLLATNSTICLREVYYTYMADINNMFPQACFLQPCYKLVQRGNKHVQITNNLVSSIIQWSAASLLLQQAWTMLIWEGQAWSGFRGADLALWRPKWRHQKNHGVDGWISGVSACRFSQFLACWGSWSSNAVSTRYCHRPQKSAQACAKCMTIVVYFHRSAYNCMRRQASIWHQYIVTVVFKFQHPWGL